MNEAHDTREPETHHRDPGSVSHNEIRPRRPRSATHPVRQVLRTDTLVWITGTVCLLFLPAAWLPFLSRAQKELLTYTYGELLLVSLTVFALQWNLQRVTCHRERCFWNNLTFAFSAWLAVKFLYLFYPQAASRPLWAELTAEVLWTCFFAAWLLALERRAHLRQEALPSGLEGHLLRSASTFFIVAISAYFWVIPVITNLASYESLLPSMYLYLVLDAYLVLRAGLSARQATDERWRTLYRLMALAALIFTFSDLVELMDYSSGTWAPDLALQSLWNSGFLVLVLAARVRHRSFPGEDPSAPGRVTTPRPGPGARTLVLALVFPWIHLGFYAWDVLDPVAEPIRQKLVIAAILILGGIALAQHRLFDQRTRLLETQRLQLEATLRKNESDLRLMRQRQQSRERLRKAAERFDSFFRFTERHRARLEARRRLEVLERLESSVSAFSPDGRILYRNPSGERRFGGTLEAEVADRHSRWTAVRDPSGEIAAWLQITAGATGDRGSAPVTSEIPP